MDESQAHLDTCRPATAGVELSVVDERASVMHGEAAERGGDILREAPVRRDVAAINQAALRERINAGRNRRDAARARLAFTEPRGDRIARLAVAKRRTARDDNRIEDWRRL